MNDKPVFTILGAAGFPYKVSAPSKKFGFIAKALIAVDFNVVLINLLNTERDLESDTGQLDGANFVFLSGSQRRTSFYDKCIGYIKAIIKLPQVLKTQRNIKKTCYLMISYSSFFLTIYYWILAKLFGYKLLISLMEYHPSIAKGFIEKLKANFFDHYAIYLANAALPISQYLENLIYSKRKNLCVFKIPVLADYNYFNMITSQHTKNIEKYFLYCGSLGYYEVIDLIIKSFLSLKDTSIKLYLVISGKNAAIQKLTLKLKNYENIKVFTNVPENNLIRMFSSSIGLLIPMRPVLQDKARFPQKVAEYLASGSPIITNAVGEISHYLKDQETAIFADDYSTDSYKNAMRLVIDNPAIAQQIGEKGRLLGWEKFHYESISSALSNFLAQL